MAQKTSPCLTTVQPPPGAGGCFVDFLRNQTAGLNRFAQRRGGRGPGIINAYLLAGLPQSEYNRRG
ncbi:TPA: biopolymer transporter TonB [Klebsiella pneumoniae]|nr:biopolymer transporter TonB [Klebsiella pneumoniae]